MSRVIINVATTTRSASDVNPAYVIAQQRLLKTASAFGFSVLYWTDSYPPESPTHQEVPYAMKPYAFLHAREKGFTSVLWADANVWVRRDPTPIFEQMERDGSILFRNGWNCGQWCTDAALEKQGVTRDEAIAIPDFTGCCMGLDLTNARSQQFLREWKASADDGVSFIGPWNNAGFSCSRDTRCLGHRHDQVIGSLIAHRLKMPLTDPLPQFSYWNGGDIPDTVLMVNGR